MFRLVLKIALFWLIIVGGVAFAARSLPRPEWNMVAFFPVDDDRLHILDIAHRLIRPLPLEGSQSAWMWSPDGRYLVYEVNSRQIHLFDTLTGTSRSLTPDTRIRDHAPVWSGDNILFRSFQDNRYDIYSMDIHGGNVRKLLDEEREINLLAVTPDGAKLAWLEQTDTGYELMVSDGDGSNRRQVTSNPDMQIRFTPISWSSDGRMIVCVTQVNELRAITTIDVESGETRRIRRIEAYNPEPVWAADNRHIAYWIADNRTQSTLYVMDADGNNVQKIASFTPQITLTSWRR